MENYEDYNARSTLDEIDQFLEKEFGIGPGRCSSIECLKYSVAREVAEKLWKRYEI